MGTGVGEAALAAEAIGAAEAAGAIGGGAGFLEGMAGVSALEGAGVAGLGLGTGAGLGTGLAGAGGLGALSPAFQTALGETAAVMPEVAAQTAQFANVGAMPPAGATFGWNPADLATAGQGAGDIATQALNPMSLAQQFGSGIQNVTPEAFNELGAVETADLMKNIDPRMVQGYMPMDTPDAANMAEKARFTEHWVRNPSALSPATAADVAQVMDAGFNPATATTEMGGNLARQTMNYVDPADMARASVNAADAAKSPFFNPLSSIYSVWKDQDPLTKGVTGGIAALQAAKYLNKPQGVAAPEKYNGPLSKFTYSPDTYRPYTYKPYAAGGPVEEMSRENAIGANTGYPQSDIQQGAYATPWQTPVSRNVVSGAGDANVDQMTGMERMAEGGSTGGDGASSGAGDTGIAALGPMMYSPAMMSSSLVDPAAEYAAAQPTMDMSRQNFQNFLARYQNLPITEAAPPPIVYKDLTAVGGGPKPTSGAFEGASDGYQYSPVIYFASGGISALGGYSDGGRLLRGPGDGMSDNIPANISGKQPARLADGEFVVPADVVSGLGNGSTDAGAKQLYKMLDKVRSARTGTKKQGKQIKADKYTPA